LRLLCREDAAKPRYCYLTFSLRPTVVVEYLIPTTSLQQWRAMHEDVIRLLDGFVKN
jgi:hypothetical protein